MGILKNYEIEAPKQASEEIKESGVFDWEATNNDPFTIELHKIAREALGKEDIKANWGRMISHTIMLLIAMSQMYYFGKGYWFSMFTMPLSYWIWAVNIFHDASHFAFSKKWKFNQLAMEVGFMFSTPYAWYHQHIIGHHSFPNIEGRDPDLYHAPKYIRHSKDVRHKSAHVYQTLTFILTWLVGVPASLVIHGVT
jgi:hypothetical protein